MTNKGLANNEYLFGHPAFTAQYDCCYFGLKTCYDATNYHTGIDYRNNGFRDIIACNFGQITHIEYMSTTDHGMGNNIIIEHELSNGEKIYSTYSHLDSIEPTLYIGKTVTKGEKLGVMGGSGYGKANYWAIHLHFELKTHPVTNNPSGTGLHWGYTPNHPATYGYLDLNAYIDKVSVKTPTIGCYSDGFRADGASQAFADCYEEFKEKIGYPFDNDGGIYVHQAGSVWVQDYKQPD
ncbi:MAG: M23 family metallopeptidase, partial [bacterium]